MAFEEMKSAASRAKSAEELLTLAKENGIELTEEQAANYLRQTGKSGEISDDELDIVFGGGCQTKVGGTKHTVVTSGCKCFTGQFESIFVDDTRMEIKPGACWRAGMWTDFSSKGTCGQCMKLGMKDGALGYCTVG